jgi:hypothetical protein
LGGEIDPSSDVLVPFPGGVIEFKGALGPRIEATSVKFPIDLSGWVPIEDLRMPSAPWIGL